MDWGASLAGFMRSLQHEGKSPHTLSAYQRDIASLQALAVACEPGQLKPAQLRHFVARLHGQGISGRSLARMLAAWRGLFDWLISQQQLTSNPCKGLRPPKTAKKLPAALSVDATAALLEGVDACSLLEQRDLAMFELMYSSGLRLAEMTRLNLEDIDFAQGLVRVTGKGNKARIVPLGQTAQQALHAWLALRPAQNNEMAVFTGQHGRRLGERQIEKRLSAWSLRSGTAMHVHPHMLRHSFASHLLQSSGDLRAVQEMLGHANLSSTQIYTSLDYQHLAQVYDAAHPRARKGKPADNTEPDGTEQC